MTRRETAAVLIDVAYRELHDYLNSPESRELTPRERVAMQGQLNRLAQVRDGLNMYHPVQVS